MAVATQFRGADASNHSLVHNHSAAQAAGLPDHAATVGARCLISGGNFTLLTVAKSNLDISDDFSIDPLQPALDELKSADASTVEVGAQ